MNIEAFIPDEYSLNGAAAELNDDLRQDMEALARSQRGDLLDWSLIDQDDEGIIRSAEVLAEELGMTGSQGEVVALRALLFSRQTLNKLSIADLDIDFSAYLEEISPICEGNVAGYIAQEVSEYFTARPELAALVEEYTPMIDSAGGYGGHVAVLCGLSYMLLERAIAEECIALEIETATIQDFTGED